MKRLLLALLALWIAPAAVAEEDVVAVAKLVHAPAVDAAQLAKAIASKDALMRATAARVASVRGVAEVLPVLREAIAVEADAAVAREQIRALVLAGTPDDVALAAKQLPRFPASLDGEFTEVIARRGAPGAVALYLAHAGALRDARSAPLFALWGRSSLAGAAAAQYLGRGDVTAFRGVVSAVAEAKLELDAGVVTSALRAESTEVRAIAVWYLVVHHADTPAAVPAEAATAREGAGVEEAFGRELLRRMRGGEVQGRAEWTAWLKETKARGRITAEGPHSKFLTAEERAAVTTIIPADVLHVKLPPDTAPVERAPFRLQPVLPAGLAQRILSKARCRDQWIGTVKTTVDRAGRVTEIDVSNVYTSEPCRQALATMLALSFAEPETIASPLSTNVLVAVRAENEVCFDEAEPRNVTTALQQAGGAVRAPVNERRSEPPFPQHLRKPGFSEYVIIEAVITRTGCVRPVRLVRQSSHPELNVSSLLTLAKWKFKPGMLDGQPVDVLFYLTIRFRV